MVLPEIVAPDEVIEPAVPFTETVAGVLIPVPEAATRTSADKPPPLMVIFPEVTPATVGVNRTKINLPLKAPAVCATVIDVPKVVPSSDTVKPAGAVIVTSVPVRLTPDMENEFEEEVTFKQVDPKAESVVAVKVGTAPCVVNDHTGQPVAEPAPFFGTTCQ